MDSTLKSFSGRIIFIWYVHTECEEVLLWFIRPGRMSGKAWRIACGSLYVRMPANRNKGLMDAEEAAWNFQSPYRIMWND